MCVWRAGGAAVRAPVQASPEGKTGVSTRPRALTHTLERLQGPGACEGVSTGTPPEMPSQPPPLPSSRCTSTFASTHTRAKTTERLWQGGGTASQESARSTAPRGLKGQDSHAARRRPHSRQPAQRPAPPQRRPSSGLTPAQHPHPLTVTLARRIKAC